MAKENRSLHEPAAEPGRFAILMSRYRFWFTTLGTLFIFSLMAVALYKLTAEVRYDDVLAALQRTNWISIALALLFTLLSFGALTFYDFNALDYIGKRLPPATVALTSIMSYAVGNTVGFGPLSGGAIRLRAYSRMGVSPADIGRVIAFVTIAFGMSLLMVTALAILMVAPRVASFVGMNPLLLRLSATAVIVAILSAVAFSSFGKTIRIGSFSVNLPDSLTASRQFLASAADIAFAGSVLYVLLPDTSVGWPSFLAIYATAVGIGVLSHVPAGLGVFETVIMAGLGNTISVDQLLSSLVLYRIIYNVLPLVMAVIFTTFIELRSLRQRPVVSGVTQVLARIAPTIIAAITILAGMMLVFSSVVPTPDAQLQQLASWFPLPMIEGAHFLSSLLGLILLVSARGLTQRLDGAWWVSFLAAALAFILAFIKAIAPFEATLLALLLFALFVNRRQYDRHASLFKQALGPKWFAAVMVIIITATVILLFIYRDTQYSHELWWQFELSDEAPRALRAMLGLSVGALALSLMGLLRPALKKPEESDHDGVLRAAAIVMQQEATEANLVRMGDKHLIFSQSKKAFIMYGAQGRTWLALGDPVGDPDEFSELVWSFVSAARLAGCRPTFYQISPALLSICADIGLRAFRLGEMAIVDLTKYDLASSKYAPMRQAVNRGSRDGLSFELIDTAQVPAIFDEIAAVSDQWLSDHKAKEKGFSLGTFERDYILQQPVVLLRQGDKVVAFATLMLTDLKQEATVDLMRFSPDAPKGSMDFLFAKLLARLKDDGYQHFNLGMAPLSGMTKKEFAPVWDRIGNLLFEHGQRFYNFKGLRAFKTKFHPNWEPRYLAASNTTNAALALMDATLLIGGGVKGIISK